VDWGAATAMGAGELLNPTYALWLSIVPPLLAIVLAMVTRQVYISLFAGIVLGCTILADGDPLLGLQSAIDACISVFQDGGSTKVIIFSAMVGALIIFTQVSGGVAGFVRRVSEIGRVNTPRRAMLLSYVIGIVVFIESSITSLVNGSICRPLFDKLKVSREKLAYLCDATAAPVCILIPLNAWGAYIIALLDKEGVEEPVSALVASMPTNFYAWMTLLFALGLVISGRDYGPMATAEKRVRDEGKRFREGSQPMTADALEVSEIGGGEGQARNLIIPVLVMVLMMPIGLFITGDGNLLKGSGSTSVLWAVLSSVTVAAVMTMRTKKLGLSQTTALFFKGCGALVPLACLMVLAFAIGAVSKTLGTGDYVAQVVGEGLPVALIPLLTFGAACLIAFSTGTSWGTFAIMLPIAVPLAAAAGVSLPLLISAVLGGGVFGDHCSPISDTTLVSSMAAGTDHIDHVNTQIPYALPVAFAAMTLYLVMGLLG
jgi:tetracycline resistance efflux pump